GGAGVGVDHRRVQVAAGAVERDQGGGRVQQDRVADRPGLAAEQVVHRLRVEGHVAAAQGAHLGAGDAEHRRVEGGLRGGALVDHPHGGGGGDGELVEPVVAAEDQRRDAALGEDPGQHREHARIVHADRLRGGAGRVGERPEEVEDGGDADLLAGRPGEAQRRVVDRREAEGDARLGGHPGGLLGGQVELDAEVYEHVGGAARGGGGAVAVLDDA